MTDTVVIHTLDELIRKFGKEFEIVVRNEKNKRFKEMFQVVYNKQNADEIRKTLDLQPVEGGDNHYLQVNITTMDKIVNTPIEENPEASNQLKTDITTTEEK